MNMIPKITGKYEKHKNNRLKRLRCTNKIVQYRYILHDTKKCIASDFATNNTNEKLPQQANTLGKKFRVVEQFICSKMQLVPVVVMVL